MGFHDESGVSERPFVHTTWAPKGKTPIIQSSGSWKRITLSGVIITDPEGVKPRLFLRSIVGNINSEEVILFVKDLKRHLRGKKLLLIWDGLPAHRSRKVQAYLATQKYWLRVARLPSYAPELNPIEYLWDAMKKKYLANLAADLVVIGKTLRQCRRQISDRNLLRGFLCASELY
ncbi:transposase [Candidatus Falkowbacteria bacterium]|nr:transposase [Candidatus Falkowbacteria bacterium]